MFFANIQVPIRIIARTKLTGIGEHWGLQLPNGDVAHLSPEGEKIVSLIEFAQGRPVKQIRKASPDQYAAILKRVSQSIQNPGQYRLLDRNCETYATWLMGEKPHSPQVITVFILGLIAAYLQFA